MGIAETRCIEHHDYNHVVRLVIRHDKKKNNNQNATPNPPPDIYRRKALLTFLFGSCTGRLLELFSIVWFRRIISYH